MSTFLKTLLSMSLAGSILLLALLALRPLLRKRTTRVFQYALWLLVLFRLLFPLSLGFGLLPRVFEAVPGPEAEATVATNSEMNETNAAVSVPTAETGLTSPSLPPDGDTQTKNSILPRTNSALTTEKKQGKDVGTAVSPGIGPAASAGSPSARAHGFSAQVAALLTGLCRMATLSFWTLSRTLSVFWAAGVCISLLRLFGGYRRLNLALKTFARPSDPWEKALLSKLTDKPVALCRSSMCMTPMLMGLRHPVIVLPDQEYDELRLTDILLHELTHQRRYDLLYKWLTAAVCAIHWFNPLMPLLQREINRACELACDEAVIRNMDLPNRMRYGETLLSVASDVRHPVGAISATMCEEKRTMRERLSAIGSHGGKTRRMVVIAAAALAAVLLFAAALGVFTPEKSTDGSEWLAELCDAKVWSKPQSELLGRFAAYLKDHSSDFTSEDITKRYDRAELTSNSGGGSIVLFYQDAMGLTVADRLSCDGASEKVRRLRSTVEDTESSPSSREIHVIHDGGYAYGYYVLTLEKWPSDEGTASNIRVYDAKKQRARLLIGTEKEVKEVVWCDKTNASDSASFTVNTTEGINLTFQFDSATLTAKTDGGMLADGKGAFDSAEIEALRQKAAQDKDMRGGICGEQIRTLEENEYDPAQIMTFTFNAGTIFSGHEAEAKAVMEAGKNPGLGIRALHDEGITGKGVNVAIIDQNLLLDHPEFAGKIAAYYDTGCGQPADSGSMCAPAVTSLLVGENIGVAPGAKVYYAAAPSWKYDSAYDAEGLRWIIQQNAALPEGEKIRVVSMSSAPGDDSLLNHEQWNMAVAEAQAAGILVLDCSGFIWPAFYNPAQPEDVKALTCGFPSIRAVGRAGAGTVYVPSSYRTVAEEYQEGVCSYQYTGEGGCCWAIPYAAGVLALGWQIDPSMTAEEAVNLLKESCYQNKKGVHFINPPAFIDAVRAQLAD